MGARSRTPANRCHLQPGLPSGFADTLLTGRRPATDTARAVVKVS